MTATPPPDPLAMQQDSNPDRSDQAPADAQRLLEENRALRELLAAQVNAQLPRPPGPLRRLAWWLVSAPGAALVGWRQWLGHEESRPITRKRVGCATLTVLYTFAIYGLLVLLVVYWSTPQSERTGASAAGPVRLPLQPLQPLLPPWENEAVPPPPSDNATPGTAEQKTPASAPTPAAPPPHDDSAPRIPAQVVPPSAATVPTAPVPTLRITEIPAEPQKSWIDELKAELSNCAALSFFDRPDCAWAARRRFCEPNHAWGTLKECPAQP